jgi:hypothetical protein
MASVEADPRCPIIVVLRLTLKRSEPAEIGRSEIEALGTRNDAGKVTHSRTALVHFRPERPDCDSLGAAMTYVREAPILYSENRGSGPEAA